MTNAGRRRTRWMWVTTVSVVLAVGGVLAIVIIRQGETEPAQLPAVPPVTARITRQTLTQATTVAGRLGFGEPVPLLSAASGIVTWLPAAGETITRGANVLRADERPVVLLYGALPMYRALAQGVKGTDVAQFEANLQALGYSGFTVDEEFTAGTTAAVKRWQKDLRMAETGGVDQTNVIYSDGAIRIAGLSVRVGASATGQVLTYTGVVRVVTVNLPAGDMAWAVRGAKVTVTLPGDRAVAGEIAAVGNEASGSDDSDASAGGSSSGASGATITATISIADQQALGSLERSPVDVRYTAQQRQNVLAVPVAALLALAEGGYGLEIVENRGTTRIVAVETGMVADGLIEVRADHLAEGMTVGMAG